uniref:Elongation of fatty acids protein n=1 Tax=Isochrysis galbana TaxID=37099 RepID=Q8W213_ISOGA|nr:long chain polyunsaturated fatty acid elongation enzyme [Isochrysis galbana]APW79686.1 elongation of fatty acids protein [synthetic construct]
MALANDAGERIWAAVTDPEILIGTFSYLLLKPLLRNSGLVDEKKGAYRTSMIWYNVLLALFSALSFYVTATALGWDYGTGAWLRRQTGDTPQPLFQCPSPVWDSKLFTWTAKAFYYSKYVEYLDTAWLVLKGKRVSFLQAFHHFGAPWDVYLGIRLHNEGVWIFMFFNSFIHTIMYTYYGLTAAGYKFKAKPLITAMQICQFVGGFLLVWDYINVPCFNSDKGKLFSWAFNYAYVGSVFLLFCHFFYQDNLATKKSAKAGKQL